MSDHDPSYDRRLELEEFARKSSHKDRTCAPVTVSFVARAHAEAVRRGDGQIAFGFLKSAFNIVSEAMYALAPVVRVPDPYYEWLWQHRDTLPDPAYAEEFSLWQWVPDQADVESLSAD